MGRAGREPPAAVPTLGALARRAVGTAAAARLPRGAAGAERVAAVPLPLPLLSSHPAARLGMRKIPENEKGGGRGSCAPLGEGTISSSPPRRLKALEWATGSECSRPVLGSARPALQPQPRVCRMWHLGEGEPSGSRRARVCGVGGPGLGTSAVAVNSLPWAITAPRRRRTCLSAIYGLAVKVTASN